MSWRVVRRAAALVACLAALAPASASALSLVPPKPLVQFGVSDKGTTA